MATTAISTYQNPLLSALCSWVVVGMAWGAYAANSPSRVRSYDWAKSGFLVGRKLSAPAARGIAASDAFSLSARCAIGGRNSFALTGKSFEPPALIPELVMMSG